MPDANVTKPHENERAHVLVVDDEVLARETFGALLEDEDYEVSLASSGDEAILILSRQSIDVLCTDYQMPGMNGIELMNEAGKISPSTVSVLVTGFPDIDDDESLGKSTRHLLLLKPFNPDEVCRVLAQATRFSKIRGLLSTLPEGSTETQS